MNNLSNERLLQRLQQFEAAGSDARAMEDSEFARECEDVASVIRELLALREAGKEPVAATMFKPVADLFLFKAPGCRWWSITEDAESISEMVRSGWPVREYVTLERFQQSYAAPQLPAVPEGWVMVPSKLTAENGAKAALLGEFLESKYISCPECFGDDECESCDGSGRIKVDVTVSWDTIKRIYSSSVELFCKEGAAIAAAPQNQPQNIPEIIPDGWVIVPKVPTEDMVINGFESDPDAGPCDDVDAQEAYEAMSGCQQAAHRAKLCWAAMIAAAPKPEVK
ncbi:hypothetical protein RJE46_04925 [Cedecea neteri]|uniref:hypothetical protein n=1 Tax=Cedecea neteri TaxID=158822 RepID=UPI0028933219|nr:hypothetical protein [Cedecea neteri]WNJ80584.1 hypothetical protein RJE46_04925 [Cedecea neteri]